MENNRARIVSKISLLRYHMVTETNDIGIRIFAIECHLSLTVQGLM